MLSISRGARGRCQMGEPSVPPSDAWSGIVGAAGTLSKKNGGFFLEIKI